MELLNLENTKSIQLKLILNCTMKIVSNIHLLCINSSHYFSMQRDTLLNKFSLLSELNFAYKIRFDEYIFNIKINAAIN